MAWPYAASALNRRKATARQHIEDGRANDQTTADHRRRLDGAPSLSPRCTSGFLAGADAGAQAAHARLGCARQQDGAHGLGVAHQKGRLQGSGSGRGVSRDGGQRRRGRRRVWHNSRRDGAGRTREWQSATQARKAEMDPVRELPYWPAAMALLIEAGQMTASDYVPTYPDLTLASEGASTDAVRCHGRSLTFISAHIYGMRSTCLISTTRPSRSEQIASASW